MKRTVGGLTLGCLIAYSGLALPSQKITTASARSAVETSTTPRLEAPRLNRTPTLARNSPTRPEAASVTAAPGSAAPTPKEASKANKSTISRCWKRLMNVVREANHAHRNKQ